MPAVSKSQQRLFSMALAVRKGKLDRNKVNKSVLDIVDGKMTDEQIHHFTVLKEHKMRSLYEFLINNKSTGIIQNKKEFKDPNMDLDEVYDYNGDEWNLIAIYNPNGSCTNCDSLNELLRKYDDSGAMKDIIDTIDENDIIVAVRNSYADDVTAVFVWGPDGVCYENKKYNKFNK